MQRPFNIVLFEPVIPQNTGSIARLCACTATRLHLIHPLGFNTDETSVRRAGLDYWKHVEIFEHANFEDFLKKENPEQLFFFSKFAEKNYSKANFNPGCYFVFGNETKGLPERFHKEQAEQFLFIPMQTHLVRSLNLAQSAGIVLYEALRQTNALETLQDETQGKYVEYGDNPMRPKGV